MEIIIAGSNTRDIQITHDLLGTVPSTIITVNNIDAFGPSLSKQTSLVIFHDNFIDKAIIHFGAKFINDLPCLVIGNFEDGIPKALTKFHSVDFLDRSVPAEQLIHKVHFLLHHKDLLNQIQILTEKLDDSKQSIQENLNFLDMLATRDGLTGLYNRRHFTKLFTNLFQASLETGNNLCLVLIDIDYFSHVNKMDGQGFGDFVLNELSARITETTRSKDLSFRFGGEDFAILMPDTEIDISKRIAQDLRQRCIDNPFSDGLFSKEITISIGISASITSQPRNQDDLVTMAEMALYNAKSEGRNRVVDYGAIAEPADISKRNFSSLKNSITKILDKTRSSAISSLQLLAYDIAGEKNRAHIQQVNKYAVLLSKTLKLPETIISTFQNAITLHASIRCLLHNEITSKSGKLSQDERDTLEEFPFHLMELSDLFDYFSSERSVLLSYGERFDGSGYPDGLKGNEIPLGARIFNVVDSLAAMNSDRPFRNKLTEEEIIQQLTEGAGGQFDPFLIHKTLDIIQEHSLLEIEDNILVESKSILQKNFPESII